MRIILIAAALASLAAPAWAQDALWIETTFHRVHLRNGNFIDGKVLAVGNRDVQLAMPVGTMLIRKDTIDRIELMKIRTLGEKPRLDPPLKKTSSADRRLAIASRSAAPRTELPMPEAEDALKSNVQSILSRLKIATPYQRGIFVEQLAGDRSAAAYVAALMPAMEDDAARFLGDVLMRMKDPDALPYLAAALNHERPFIRVLAIDVLAHAGSPEMFPALRKRLDDLTTGVRVAAMGALSRLGDADSLRLLIALMTDENAGIRAAAVSNALVLGQKTDRMGDVQEGLRLALGFARGQALRDVIWVAGRSGRKELWRALALSLTDPESATRGLGAEALAMLAAPESIEALIPRLRSEDDKGVRLRLATVAQALKNAEAVPALMEWLRSSDREIVAMAAKSLQSITRQQYGESYEKWSDWWESTRSK